MALPCRQPRPPGGAQLPEGKPAQGRQLERAGLPENLGFPNSLTRHGPRGATNLGTSEAGTGSGVPTRGSVHTVDQDSGPGVRVKCPQLHSRALLSPEPILTLTWSPPRVLSSPQRDFSGKGRGGGSQACRSPGASSSSTSQCPRWVPGFRHHQLGRIHHRPEPPPCLHPMPSRPTPRQAQSFLNHVAPLPAQWSWDTSSPVSASRGHCDRSPPTWLLKTTWTDSLTVWAQKS